MPRGLKRKAGPSAPVVGPWELPHGWRWERLGDLAGFLNGAAFKPTDWHDSGIPIIRIQNLTNPSKEPNRTQRILPERYLVRLGDILVSWSATLDAFIWHGDDAWLNQHIFKVENIRSDVRKRYLFYLLKTEVDALKRGDHLHGSTMMHINRGPFLAHPVPVPPLDVQVDLVARLDEIFEDLDDGELAITTAQRNVETYRKALFKAAMTGELTGEWRHARRPAETGAQYLDRLVDGRSAANLGRRGQSASPIISAQMEAPPGLPELPPGWCWTRLEHLICDGPTNGYSPKSGQHSTGTPSLKLTATSGGRMRLDPDCIKVLNETIEAGSGLFLKPGDLLFQRGNTPELVGIAALFDGPPDTFIYPDLMIRVRTADSFLANWLWRWANSPHGRAHMMSNAQGAAGSMPKISGGTVRNMPVPIGPPDEMVEVLRLLDHALQAIDLGQLEAEIVRATTLRQSILAVAFRGELAG